MNEMPESLLAADEPAPVTVHNENGSSPFLIVADHAGNSFPRALGRLGPPATLFLMPASRSFSISARSRGVSCECHSAGEHHALDLDA